MPTRVCEPLAQRRFLAPRPKPQTADRGGIPIWPLTVAVAISAVAGLLVTWFWRERAPVPRLTQVKDVMVRNVVTIEPSATLAQAARLMRHHNVGLLPVILNSKLAGVITDRDLVVRALAEGADPTMTEVGEFVSTEPVCARPDTRIEDAMEVMAACQVGRLPVVDYNDQLVGVVTLSSLALRSPENRETLHTAQEVSRRSARSA